MYDNKVRLSQDVLEKASQIASEWGLKNARAAVEAVFRKYADEYLQGRQPMQSTAWTVATVGGTTNAGSAIADGSPDCEALNELDDLLGL